MGISLNIALKGFFKLFLRFLRAIVAFLGSSNTNSFSMDSCKSGSTNLIMSGDPAGGAGSTQASAQFAALSAALAAGGTIAGISVLSSSVSVVGGTVPAPYGSTTNLGLILGICIPIGIISKSYLIFKLYWP
jgi:hypothetical protein